MLTGTAVPVVVTYVEMAAVLVLCFVCCLTVAGCCAGQDSAEQHLKSLLEGYLNNELGSAKRANEVCFCVCVFV